MTTGYNAAGYATTLTRASDGTVYGTVQAMDAWGHATQVHEANGVTITRGYSQVTGLAQDLTAAKGNSVHAQYTYDFDHFGNLAEREDVLNGATEIEHYDDLNRLKKNVLSLSGGGGGTTTYGYDDAGNLTWRTGRGTYSYGENGAGPHAVTSISDGSTFSYNENGEMTAGGDRTLAWATFGQATAISESGTTVALAYDAENARYRKTVSGASEETVLYLGAAEKLTVNGQTSIRRTLSLADLTIIDTGGNNAGVLFPVSDHLGSTIVLDDGGGASVQAMSYSPFGERMTAGWAGSMSSADALTINTTESDRGYTGQEGLDAVGLWDYNARLYDPALGRFLSVDPLIAHPESTQGINPYSYVENNPLNKTDPTGEAPSETGCLSSQGGTCTFTPTGSHIPQTVTSTPTSSGLSFSGAMAGPGGHFFATSTDFNSRYSASVSSLGSQGITGQDPAKASDHTRINGNSPSSANGNTDSPPPPPVIDAGGNTKELQAELNKLPQKVLEQLEAGGVKFVAVKDSVTEYLKDLKGVKPRGWPPGSTWDTVPGTFDRSSKTVVIATSGRYQTGSYDFVLHEAGHAYNFIRGNLSDTPAFRAAYDAAKPSLGAYETQPGRAGRQEAFAEGFARYYGRDPSYPRLQPALYSYWENGP